MMRKLILPAILGLVLAVMIVWINHHDKAEVLPSPQNHTQNPPPPVPAPPTNGGGNLPAEINLNVPFTSQAPHSNWSEPYQNFCEEASSLMAASFILDQPLNGPDDADQKLLSVKDYEDKTFGSYLDTTAAQTAQILTDHFKVSASQVKLMDNPTVDSIKQALAAGKVVLVPAAGQDLPNPNFVAPGPIYHMLVIKGYTKDGKFITNDPGTRKGANFTYKFNDLMNTIHDWTGFDRDIHEGKRVVIVVG